MHRAVRLEYHLRVKQGGIIIIHDQHADVRR